MEWIIYNVQVRLQSITNIIIVRSIRMFQAAITIAQYDYVIFCRHPKLGHLTCFK